MPNARFSRTAEIAEHAEEENRPGIPDDQSPKRQRGVEYRLVAPQESLRTGRLRSRLGKNGVLARTIVWVRIHTWSPVG